jgi:putative acetyltransferase
MKIIDYSPSKAQEITELFYRSVHSIDSSIYSEEQKEAWAPRPIDYHKWRVRLARKRPYLAMINDRVVGFIELESDGHIDCTYVSPEFQRRGVAKALLRHVISVAKDLNIKKLYVEASIVATPLFKSFGFSVQHENKVIRNNTVLINYTMSKWCSVNRDG